MDLISVVLPIYNEPLNFIEQSISSILGQTYRNIQLIIIIDNPQRNDVLNYINSIRDDRFEYIINKKNIGLPRSLNLGISLSRGKYIARMDADDISDNSRLSKQLIFLKERNLDLCACLYFDIDEKGIIIRKTANLKLSPNGIKKLLRFRDPLAHPTWIGKRELFVTLDGYRNFHACEDYDFLLRAKKSGAKLGLLPEYLLYYRKNSNSISNKNLYRQFLSAKILKKNYSNLESMNVESFEKILNRNYSEEQSLNFLKAKSMLSGTSKKNVLLRFYSTIQAIFIFPGILEMYTISIITRIISLLDRNQ